MGPPSVLPPFARDGLNLTEEQRKQLDELDSDVRTRLDKILTADQKQELNHSVVVVVLAALVETVLPDDSGGGPDGDGAAQGIVWAAIRN